MIKPLAVKSESATCFGPFGPLSSGFVYLQREVYKVELLYSVHQQNTCTHRYKNINVKDVKFKADNS